MNTLVVYFSYTGRSRREAKHIAAENGAELYEVREQRHRSPMAVLLFGSRQARRRKCVYIEPIAVDMSEYDRIIIVCPIWGGYPAPAFNNIINEIPQGRRVELVFTSDSGRSKARALTTLLVESKGISVTKYRVIKTKDFSKREFAQEKQLISRKRKLL